ncbi:DUF3300 domain-containing protein [Methylonatrum kenyense]|uniref:DUF3300 domain-containing protein n=1 Tax=Methylonatrum kenyense TaxID=455253 RepID=UPI0020C10672|nr:DUF3300 domain-containing protein [Methylonatrum kenyense]MCK8516887.1 DUF3300 domain-containing protein [Methylonatrum kenyense]
MWLRRFYPALLVLLLLPSFAASAQQEFQPVSDAELDQALAPVALYPDTLLSQILIASTYPVQVVDAARWSRQRPGLDGSAAVEAAAGQDWDPSVQALVAFPQVLQRMDQDLTWTSLLGEAVMMDEGRVLDRVQYLRERAYQAGELQSDQHVEIIREREVIYIEPREVHVVHVPYYDPRYVYGSWWHSAYPPVYWSPPPRYRPHHGFYWGKAYPVSGFFFSSVLDWRHRHVTVISVHSGSRSLRPPKSVRHLRSGHRAQRWSHRRTAGSPRNVHRGRDFRPSGRHGERRSASTRRQDSRNQYQRRRPPSRLQSGQIRDRRQQDGTTRRWSSQRQQAPNTARERHQQQFGRQQQSRSGSRDWQQRRESTAPQRGHQRREQRATGRDGRGFRGGSGSAQRQQRSERSRQQRPRDSGARQQRGQGRSGGAQRERSFSGSSGRAQRGGERRAGRGSPQRQGGERSRGGQRRGSGR